MSEENRQQQSSAESTVAGAAKTGKAIASIAKGAATGGAHGAAVEAAKSSKKWTIPIVAVILLPVLIIAMLPSVIFGSLFGDGTDTPNGISDDTVLVQNLADINSGISMILSEGLDDVLARIDSDFAASGCDGKEVNNPFGSDVVFNANAIVSQYCAYKDTDAASISKDDTVIVVTTNSDYSGCRDMNQSVISRMDLIYDMEAPDLNTMVKRVMNVTGFTDEQEATKMAIVVRDVAERCRQTMITDGSCGMREFKSWVLSTMVTHDPYESALSTIISSASADPDNRAELISACLEPQYTRTI